VAGNEHRASREFGEAVRLTGTKYLVRPALNQTEIWDCDAWPFKRWLVFAQFYDKEFFSTDLKTLLCIKELPGEDPSQCSPVCIYDVSQGKETLIMKVRAWRPIDRHRRSEPPGLAITNDRSLLIAANDHGLAFYPLTEAKRKQFGLIVGESHIRLTNYRSFFAQPIISDDDRWMVLVGLGIPYRVWNLHDLTNTLKTEDWVRE
jgi:hypothetical protein